MPINLTKVVTDPLTFNKNVKYTPKYFHHDLTGTGKSAGLITKYNDSLDASHNLLYNANVPVNYMIDFNKKQTHRVLAFTDEHIESAVNKQNRQSLGYHLSNKHTYDLSILSLLNQLDENDMYSYKYNRKATVSFKHAPHFLTDLPFETLATINNRTIKASLLFDRVDYTAVKKDGTVSSEKYEQYLFHSNFVITDTINNAKQTNVSIIHKASDNRELINILHDRLVENHPKNTHNQILVFTDIDPYTFSNNLQNSNLVPSTYTQELQEKLSRYLGQHYNQSNFTLDFSKIGSQSLGNVLSHQAKINDKYFVEDLIKVFKFYNQSEYKFDAHRELLQRAYHLIKLVEPHMNEVDYQHFYNGLRGATIKHHSAKSPYNVYQFNKLMSINTRLSLTHQLELLDNNTNVHQFKPTQTNLNTTNKYSPEQLNIIHTTEPYVVGVAGAGTGKSHTLIGRLEFLRQNNVDFRNVLVTSFTNTAAKNIITRFHGGINSLTNANLFHKIYQSNFDHTLTSDFTIANLLSVISSNSKAMKSTPTINNTRLQLIEYLMKSIKSGFQKVDPRSITEHLIALINERLDDVLTILNAIKQTSLLLEPIIINALMQNDRHINYPQELQHLNFIITDESQDTSAFEYVLLLELTRLNNAQLMIIGDANQTLYEFRNANPEFLNALERSSVFKTYTMSTNYRSKQSILSVSNEILNILDTNRTAKIQLHANLYSNINPSSFKNEVTISNITPEQNTNSGSANKFTAQQTALEQAVLTDQHTVDWIIDQYKNHRQIAIMAYKNRDTQAIGKAVEKVIEQHFKTTPTTGYTRLPQQRENTWLSQMISQTNDKDLENTFNNTHYLLPSQVYKSFLNRLNVIATHRRFSNGNINDFAFNTVTNLYHSYKMINKLKALNAGKLTWNRFRLFYTMELINAETRKNNMARLVTDSENTNWKDKDIVISTIHSAKGLEFDSVICYFDEHQNNATSQENLRLYGVALTRAENHELILNNPKTAYDVNSGTKVPTVVNDTEDGMYETPMRTAYNRVIIKLKATHGNNSIQP